MDTIFFVFSKLAGFLVGAETWIVVFQLLLLVAILLRWRRLALWLSALSAAFFLSFSIFPLGDLLLQPIEKAYPTNPPLDQVDGIIVLGGGEDSSASAFWGQMQLNDGGERYTEALALARRFPEARLLFTGGHSALRDVKGASLSEADLAGQFFIAQGIAPERLILEGRSRNTAENARLSLALAKPAPGETWVLVTSAFHMPRAMRSFEAAGWRGVTPWPVDYRTGSFARGTGWDLYKNLKVLDTAAHELVGLLAYRLTGK